MARLADVSARDEAAIAHVRAVLTDAAARLTHADARTEALAEYLPAGRVLLVPRQERLRPVGRVWRLGVLLLSADGDGAGQSVGVGASGPAGANPGANSNSNPNPNPYSGSGSGESPALYATGSITRAHEPGRPTYQAASAERRRQLRVAAYRGHFAPGESVNFDARPIALDGSLVGASGALSVRDGHALVRWNAVDPDAVTDVDTYLADRVALLVEPPEGA